MRLGGFGVILSLLIAGGACSTTSAEGIFTSGEAGGSGASNGGTASGTGGGLGTSGDGGSAGSFGTGGNFGSGGSGAGGTTLDADIDTGFGGTTDSGPEPDVGVGGVGGVGGTNGASGVGGTNGASGSGGTNGASGSDGVVCAGNQCDPGKRCCFPSNGSAYCTTRETECACTGLCTTTTMTCDSQSDCANGEICCATLAYSLGSVRVSSVRCQPSCSTTLVEYIVCDPNGPATCPAQTNCSQALLLSAIDVCQ
jgi:hypothetical protein